MKTTWGTLLVGLMILTGCGDAVDIDDDPFDDPAACTTSSWSGDAEVEVGTGASCFTEVAEGDVVPLIGGQQGGFHIWLGLRCRSCDATANVTFGVIDATGAFIWGNSQSAMLELQPVEDYRQTAGITAFVPGAPWDDTGVDASELVGQELSLYAEVVVDDAVQTSETRFTVGDIEWQRSSCPDCN